MLLNIEKFGKQFLGKHFPYKQTLNYEKFHCGLFKLAAGGWILFFLFEFIEKETQVVCVLPSETVRVKGHKRDYFFFFSFLCRIFTKENYIGPKNPGGPIKINTEITTK